MVADSRLDMAALDTEAPDTAVDSRLVEFTAALDLAALDTEAPDMAVDSRLVEFTEAQAADMEADSRLDMAALDLAALDTAAPDMAADSRLVEFTEAQAADMEADFPQEFMEPPEGMEVRVTEAVDILLELITEALDTAAGSRLEIMEPPETVMELRDLVAVPVAILIKLYSL